MGFHIPGSHHGIEVVVKKDENFIKHDTLLDLTERPKSKTRANWTRTQKAAREGFTSCDIAKRLGVPSPTVRNVASALRNRGRASAMPKRGRPRTVNTPKIRDTTRKRITRNHGVNMNRIASDLNINRQTIQKIAKRDLKLNNYRLRR
uniref:HTH_7 domain-containing protein n=1 Tax=Haemonchus contortus TaxID=6289 RepID=A0A7I5E8S1_HAECO